MENNLNNFDNGNINFTQPKSAAVDTTKAFVANVFSWMFAALAITSIVAYYLAHNLELLSLLINIEAGGFTMLGYIVMFSPFAFVMVMSFGSVSYTHLRAHETS